MVSLYKGNVKHLEENFCRKSPAGRACSLCINFKIDFDRPFCEEDRGDIIELTINKNNDCEYFDRKFTVG